MYLPMYLIVAAALHLDMNWMACVIFVVYDCVLVSLAGQWLEGRATIYVDSDAVED